MLYTYLLSQITQYASKSRKKKSLVTKNNGYKNGSV